MEKPLVAECETHCQYNVCEWNRKVFADPSHYYGLFVTRLLFDLALVFGPVERFAAFGEPLIYSKKLNRTSDELIENRQISEEEWNIGDAVTEDKYSIIRALRRLELEKYKWELSKVFGKQFPKFASDFVRSLKGSEGKKGLGELTRKLFYLLSSHHRENDYQNFTQPMQDMIANFDRLRSEGVIPSFCDIFQTQQMIDLIFYQVSRPYHPNVAESKRWRYVAKSNEMFLDLIVFDKCSYLYDWIPTLDMFASNFTDFSDQLITRFILDGIRKHSAYTNAEFLAYTNVIGHVSGDRFAFKSLAMREQL